MGTSTTYLKSKLPVISEHPKIEQWGGSTGKELFAFHESKNLEKNIGIILLCKFNLTQK